MFRWPGVIPAADRPRTLLVDRHRSRPILGRRRVLRGPHDFPRPQPVAAVEKSGEAIARDTLFGESFAHDIADIENPQASLLYRWVIRGHDKLLLTYDGAPGRMKYPPQGGEPSALRSEGRSG